jgi:hypothetical protein
MSERRSLTEGLKVQSPPVDPVKEKQFVFAGGKATQNPDPPVMRATPPVGRAPINARIRADLAYALKRASLERQISGTTPHRLQEILEVVLEPWLKAHGYIP